MKIKKKFCRTLEINVIFKVNPFNIPYLITTIEFVYLDKVEPISHHFSGWRIAGVGSLFWRRSPSFVGLLQEERRRTKSWSSTAAVSPQQFFESARQLQNRRSYDFSCWHPGGLVNQALILPCLYKAVRKQQDRNMIFPFLNYDQRRIQRGARASAPCLKFCKGLFLTILSV